MSSQDQPDLDGVQVVHGYEFNESEPVSELTAWVLGHLHRKLAVTFQTDDGPGSLTVVGELKKLEVDYGYFKLWQNTEHVFYLLDNNLSEVQL